MFNFSSALVLLLSKAVVGASDVVSFRGAANNDDCNKGVVVLEAFDNPAHVWKEMNDPVMGGKSAGTFFIDTDNGVGKFEGEVVDVPFLKAPGFLQARSTGGGPGGDTYPDISSCSALQIIAKSNIPYEGFRVSFGNAHAPGGKFFAYGYKSSFSLNDDGEDHNADERTSNTLNHITKKKRKDGFDVVTIPFAHFTDYWDDATGDPIKTCQDDVRYCPDEETLKNIKRLTLWAEGVAGKVSMEVKAFQAVGCTGVTHDGAPEEIDEDTA